MLLEVLEQKYEFKRTTSLQGIINIVKIATAAETHTTTTADKLSL